MFVCRTFPPSNVCSMRPGHLRLGRMAPNRAGMSCAGRADSECARARRKKLPARLQGLWQDHPFGGLTEMASVWDAGFVGLESTRIDGMTRHHPDRTRHRASREFLPDVTLYESGNHGTHGIRIRQGHVSPAGRADDGPRRAATVLRVTRHASMAVRYGPTGDPIHRDVTGDPCGIPEGTRLARSADSAGSGVRPPARRLPRNGAITETRSPQ